MKSFMEILQDISDIPATIAKMKELYNKAALMQEELRDVCSAFNEYAVGGINLICYNQNIYKGDL